MAGYIIINSIIELIKEIICKIKGHKLNYVSSTLINDYYFCHRCKKLVKFEVVKYNKKNVVILK